MYKYIFFRFFMKIRSKVLKASKNFRGLVLEENCRGFIEKHNILLLFHQTISQGCRGGVRIRNGKYKKGFPLNPHP